MPKLKYNYQYTKEELEDAIKQNVSITGTMRTLKAPLTSGTLRKKFTKLIQHYGIDTSHFLGMGWNNGLGANHKGGIERKIIRPEDNRKCTKCYLTKLAKEFYLRKRGPRSGSYYEKCKECMKSRGVNYYYQNQVRQLKLALLRKERYAQERKDFINKYKSSRSCMDCSGKFPPVAMDFDHREGEVKSRTISRMVVGDSANFEKIMQEIAKCDLVCANCHRVRTHGRIQKQKAAIANVVTALL